MTDEIKKIEVVWFEEPVEAAEYEPEEGECRAYEDTIGLNLVVSTEQLKSVFGPYRMRVENSGFNRISC